ncbi:dTDP-4-dehydrorhamnose 3,5-epimerase family protein [Amycolatopsis sp. NPDC049688]|uniref:dTDP-4-dehydrorhamnose 3,5-epimerase family protein n=1 Tax=Amycolatopsis sp. NPDC049688 TaxID=3154733 RepID=UPI0034381AAC
MEIFRLPIPDTLLIVPRRLTDLRGCFYESFKFDALSAMTGREFRLRQVNNSVSKRNVIRGIHSVVLPPGQAKIVSCVRGAVQDFVVDLRLGSPAFGEYCENRLDAESGESVFIAEGMGHAFLTLTDDTCVSYLCSSEFAPGTQIDLNPFDPGVGLPWKPASEPTVSEKDAAAPTVREAAARGLLPTYAECREWYAQAGVRSTGRLR